VAVIPNPVPLPDFINDIQRDDQVKRIGFLGRLHPRKNVESLIDAWILLGNKVADAQLVIMGKGDADYERMLKDKVASHGLDNVKFAGFVTGREKFERLASLTALCVPSDFENFGMIVTESLSVGSPVIASLGTPWQELETCHCGRWVDNSVKTLAETIESQLALPLNQINQMGENGKALVAKKYKADKVAAMMSSLYDWVQDGGILPPFVQM
jgi:glycosyltransferase involved in cell wall biosynthesis